MAGKQGCSGGRRIGSGRKPIGAVELALTGNQHSHGRVLAGPGPVEVSAVAVFDPPPHLTVAVRAAWAQLAPPAFQARTLTRTTELAFVLLCQNVVLERRLGTSPKTRGGASHRGVRAQLLAELAAFTLRPFGKPIYEAEPVAPANPLDRFLKKA
jgi:hypothetical protein